jgi:hypothetical protein
MESDVPILSAVSQRCKKLLTSVDQSGHYLNCPGGSRIGVDLADGVLGVVRVFKVSVLISMYTMKGI